MSVAVYLAVPSFSKVGRTYPVGIDLLGKEVRCDCPASSFSKDGECKHAKLVRAALAFERRCVTELHHGTGGVCLQCLVAILAASARKVKKNYRPKDAPKRSALKRRTDK